MDRASFDQIWLEIQTETYNRTKGSFKRALWYGGRTKGIKGVPNAIVGHFGSGKGVRKAIRNAPRAIFTESIGAAASAPLVLMPPVAVAAGPTVSKIVSSLVNGVVSIADLAIGATSSAIAEACIRGISYQDELGKKSVYRQYIYDKIHKKEPENINEALRKQVKIEVKDLQKAQGLQVIDRNLVKLTDAKAKIKPAIEKLQFALNNGGSTEIQLEIAHDVLTQIAETLYYIDKITNLISGIQDTLTKVENEQLSKLGDNIYQVRMDLSEYIVLTVDNG